MNGADTGIQSRTLRYRGTYEAIVDVAAHLFAANGYAATGVAQIGEASGLARGALYYYIGSKEALLAAVHDRVMDPLLAEARIIANLEESALIRLMLLSERLLTQIVERRDHVWVFLHEYHQLGGEYRERFREKRRAFENHVEALLLAGREEGSFRLTDPRLSTLAFLNLHNYTYQWIGSEPQFEASTLTRHFCGIFVCGIAGHPIDLASYESELERARAALPFEAPPTPGLNRM